MMENMRPSRPTLFAAPIAALVIVLLAGCVPVTNDPGSGQTAAPTPSPTGTASSTPSATPTPTAAIIPLDIACDQLISPDAMYTFDPNLSSLGSFVPDAGTPAASAIAAGGVACRWVHDTTGATLDVSAAELPESVSTDLKNELVLSSNSVPTYGVEGYFQQVSGVGQAQAFPDPYWVTVVSSLLFEPGDAAPLVAAAISGLG